MNLIFLILMAIMNFNQTETVPRLIYVGDPMCSWCYGFSPEISELKLKYENRVNFELIMGGLRPYTRDTMDSNLKSFLKDHWKHIERKTGQSFNYSILDRNDFVYDTEPAARAVVVARAMSPGIEFEFFNDIQQAFYEKNEDTNRIETYLKIADKYGLKREEFKRRFESDEAKSETSDDFKRSQSLGVRGFPTLLMRNNGKNVVLTYGYSKSEEIEKMLNKLLK